MNELINNNENKFPKFKIDVLQRYLFLDELLRNPIKYPIEKISKKLNLTECGVRSTIGRIRDQFKQYEITILNKLITIHVHGKKPQEKDIINNINDANNFNNKKRYETLAKNRTTKSPNYEKLLQILKKHPDGIHVESLIKKTNLDKSTIYTSIYALKRKKYNIIMTEHGYKIIKQNKSNNEIIIPPINNKTLPQLDFKNSLIPPEYKELFNNLPDNDKIDCINMLKKSMYHFKTAIALIEANQIAFNFCKELTEKGGSI